MGGGGGEGWVNRFNKKVCHKNLFIDKIKIEWSSKDLWKMVYIYTYLMQKLIKARNKRSGGSILQIWVRCMFKNWNTIWKGHVFSIWFWLVFYPYWYCPLRTGGLGLLKRWNLLSVMKVICWHSLTRLEKKDFQKHCT